MPREKRATIHCKCCGTKFRTRLKEAKENEVCRECIYSSALANLNRASKGSAELSIDMMREKWFHELVFRQVAANGLTALGLGRLSFIKKYQEADKTMGQYATKTCRFDLLLKAEDRAVVCVEIKRIADESSIAQVLRYRRVLKDSGHKNAKICILTVQLTADFLRSIEDLWELGLDVRLYQICVEAGAIILKRINGSRDEEEEVVQEA